MGNLRSSRFQFLCAFQFLMLVQTRVSCYQYKVGDLDAWGIPSSSNGHVYTNWSKNHIFKIGDSLRKFLFLVDLDFGLFLIPKNLQGWVCRSCIDLKYSHFFCYCLHCPFFDSVLSPCSVLIPTKSRFSDSSHRAVFQCLQPYRSNLVHEQW